MLEDLSVAGEYMISKKVVDYCKQQGWWYDDVSADYEIELKKMRLEGDPDLVFLSSEPYPFKEEDAFEIGRFTHHAKTIFVDGEMFSWHGSRLLKAFPYFKLLHERLKN